MSKTKKKLFTSIPETQEKGDKKPTIFSIIKRKYLNIIILLLVIGGALPNFFEGHVLLISYVFLSLLLGGCYMMHENIYYFQRMGLKHHPLLMTQYFELISVAGTTALIIHSIPLAQASNDWLPYAILRILSLLVWYQFRTIFSTASAYKEKNKSKGKDDFY